VLDGLKLPGDEAVGAQIVRRAVEEPLRRIVGNAGLEGSIVLQKVEQGRVASGTTRGPINTKTWWRPA